MKWWRARKTSHKALIGAVGLFVLLGMFGVWDDPANDPETVAAGGDPEVASTQTVANTTVATRAPPATPSLGDWPSVNAYVDDIVDTGDKMSSLLTTVAEISFDVANGVLSLSDFSILMDTAIEVASSHRDHFRGTTPPNGFETAHQHFQNALELYVDAFETAKRGADRGDFDLINDAATIMEKGTEQIQLATLAIPGQ